jgi:hypothetical protein
MWLSFVDITDFRRHVKIRVSLSVAIRAGVIIYEERSHYRYYFAEAGSYIDSLTQRHLLEFRKSFIKE